MTEALKVRVSSLSWNLEMKKTFSSDFSHVPILVYADLSASICLSVDASGSHIGVVLQQDVAGIWAPLTFHS